MTAGDAHPANRAADGQRQVWGGSRGEPGRAGSHAPEHDVRLDTPPSALRAAAETLINLHLGLKTGLAHVSLCPADHAQEASRAPGTRQSAGRGFGAFLKPEACALCPTHDRPAVAAKRWPRPLHRAGASLSFLPTKTARLVPPLHDRSRSAEPFTGRPVSVTERQREPSRAHALCPRPRAEPAAATATSSPAHVRT